MAKIFELCTPCAEKLRAGSKVTLVQHKANCKITCAECNRRRYGNTYTVSPRRKEEGKN